jgi:hypothetical protein
VAFGFYVEDASGNLDANDPIMMCTTATTNSRGNFSVAISDVGYTGVLHVQATTKDTASGVTNTTVTSVTGFSTTAVSGSVYQFTSLLGVLGLDAVGSGRTVYVSVVGSTS